VGLVHYLSFSSQKVVQETVLAHKYNLSIIQNISASMTTIIKIVLQQTIKIQMIPSV